MRLDPREEELNAAAKRAAQIKPVASIDRAPTTLVDLSIVAVMQARLTSKTKECISETFGISSNTWQKLKVGQPIRRSTAERLMVRLRHIGLATSYRQ